MIVEYAAPETYKGIKIHGYQTRERIEGRVKPQIDHVMGLTKTEALLVYVADVRRPPEARLLAGAMLEALFNLAVQDRRERPSINMDLVRAHTAGLDESSPWRSPWSYGCIADGPDSEGRPIPLTHEELKQSQMGR